MNKGINQLGLAGVVVIYVDADDVIDVFWGDIVSSGKHLYFHPLLVEVLRDTII